MGYYALPLLLLLLLLLAALIFVQAMSISASPGPAAAENHQDMLSPLLNEICKSVECGRGTCRVVAENGTAFGFEFGFGFECECEPGWAQLRFDRGDHLGFLPCVIPNCTFDSACYNDSIPYKPLIPPPHTSIFDPCLWSFCGSGTCVRTAEFEHRCECRQGFSNLLNIPSLPCFRECKLRADCPALGFTLTNTSTTTSPPQFSVRSSGVYTLATKSLWIYIWILISAVYFKP
uniref:EGF-like domain-containing protein n=1 Tax=Ananas comosus var. bracteatus TaxID=296719 RepID=A0A6V7NMJ9_ANACO|nr:unnamed protein product [Ananas comosus var. bracteatus]